MFYYIPGSNDPAHPAYLTINSTDTSATLKLFNYNVTPASYTPNPSNWTWHTAVGADGKYFLRDGINLIYIDKSMTLMVHPDGEVPEGSESGDISRAPESTLLFGDLKLVSTTASGIKNSTLGYNATTLSSAEIQLLNDLHIIDPEGKLFYYNCPINNSIAIDLNTSEFDTTARESLATARTWYDRNNINNKFVISEIDADRLNGIRIATTSKR